MNANKHRVGITDEIKLDVPAMGDYDVDIDLRGLMVRRALVLGTIASFKDAYDIRRAYVSGLQEIFQVDVGARLMLKTACL